MTNEYIKQVMNDLRFCAGNFGCAGCSREANPECCTTIDSDAADVIKYLMDKAPDKTDGSTVDQGEDVNELSTEKACENCKYDLNWAYEEPCNGCFGCSKWESRVEKETVNHPEHYNREGSMECIDEMVKVFGVEAVKNFCLLNVWKYRYRAASKNGEEDLKKSDWYMRTYVDLDR